MRSLPLAGSLLGAALAVAACSSSMGAAGSSRDGGAGGIDAGAGGSGGSGGADAGVGGSGTGGAGGRPTDGGASGGSGGLPPADGGTGGAGGVGAGGVGGAGGVTDAGVGGTGAGGVGGTGGSGGTDGGTVRGFSQGQDGTGKLTQSSGNGNDYDMFVWDDFTVPAAQDIVEVRWEGGYILPPTYPSGAIQSFDVSFWTTVANQPDIGTGPAALYEALTATQTSLGTFGGNEIFEYVVQLPSSFHLQAGTRYWVEIGAFQPGVPGWGIASGAGGNGVLFQSFVNYAGGTAYRSGTGDAAFTLLPAP